MDFKVGIYEDLDYETYASIPAWRSHDLTELIKCPYSWRNKRDISESPALHEGRVQHTVFLELHKFFDEFAIEPAVDKRTKAGKAEYNEWLETLGDRTPCKQDLYDVCMERREVVKHFIPTDEHKVELTLCFEWHGQPCKGKLDWWTGTDIWDLKTCRDASPFGFRSAINNFRYYQQAAYYLTAVRALGMRADRFYFLAQEKAHPYPYGVYTLSDEAIEYGIAKNEQAMAIGLDCAKRDEWLPFNRDQYVEFGIDELR
jgi:exodeoxyribonuclease VIII